MSIGVTQAGSYNAVPLTASDERRTLYLWQHNAHIRPTL